jgi:hypothetical protein
MSAYEHVCKLWTKQPNWFRPNPATPVGLNKNPIRRRALPTPQGRPRTWCSQPRTDAKSDRRNHQQPKWKHPQPRNRLQSQSRQQHPLASSSAVPISTAHSIGGKGDTKAPTASEAAAIAKATTSRILENLRVSEEDVLRLVDCSLDSSGNVIAVRRR